MSLHDIVISPYALISSDDLREFRGRADQGGGDREKFIINGVTELVESFCKRKFVGRRHWREVIDEGRPTDTIIVKNPPIVNIAQIVSGFELKQATGTADSGTTLTLVDNARTEANDYWNGADLSIQIAANSSKWHRTKVSDFASSTDTLTVSTADLLPSAVATGDSYRLDLLFTGLGTTIASADYRDINFDAGIITLGGSWSGLIIDYDGGYDAVPDGIRNAAIILASEALKSSLSTVSASLSGLSFSRQAPTPGGPESSQLIWQALQYLKAFRRIPVGV